jgi:hypothetical protein
VRTGRLELPHLSILEPKSSASTNSATSAGKGIPDYPGKARIIPKLGAMPIKITELLISRSAFP